MIPVQMLDNILALEESIGDAETAEPFLRAEVQSANYLFYDKYIDAVREKEEKT